MLLSQFDNKIAALPGTPPERLIIGNVIDQLTKYLSSAFNLPFNHFYEGEDEYEIKWSIGYFQMPYIKIDLVYFKKNPKNVGVKINVNQQIVTHLFAPKERFDIDTLFNIIEGLILRLRSRTPEKFQEIKPVDEKNKKLLQTLVNKLQRGHITKEEFNHFFKKYKSEDMKKEAAFTPEENIEVMILPMLEGWWSAENVKFEYTGPIETTFGYKGFMIDGVFESPRVEAEIQVIYDLKEKDYYGIVEIYFRNALVDFAKIPGMDPLSLGRKLNHELYRMIKKLRLPEEKRIQEVKPVDEKNKKLLQNLVNKLRNRGNIKTKDLEFFFKKFKEPEDMKKEAVDEKTHIRHFGKKYKLIPSHFGLYRVKALRDFGRVKKGEVGGYIEKESNLSHKGTCWIFHDVKVYDNARVYGNAKVYGDVTISDNAEVYGRALISQTVFIAGNAKVYADAVISGNVFIGNDAKVYGNAKVGDNAVVKDNAVIFGNAKVYETALVWDNARVYGNAKVYGTAVISGDAEIFGYFEVDNLTLESGEYSVKEEIVQEVPPVEEKNKKLLQNLVNKLRNRGNIKTKDLEFFFKKFKPQETTNGN